MLKKIQSFIFAIAVLLYILIEDLIYQLIIKPISNFIRNLDLLNYLSEYMKNQSRFLSLAIFLFPFILMEIAGISSYWLLAKNHVFSFIFLHLFKVLLAIPVIILFDVCKKKLLSFYIIKQVYFFILTIKSSKIYKKFLKNKHKIKVYLKRKARLLKNK